MTVIVTQVLVGPREHGVVQFGLALHAALQRHSCGAALTWVHDVHELSGCLGARSPLVHTQFTDRLFGSDADNAVTAFTRFAQTVRRRGAALTATLHDVPQPSDGVHFPSRVRAYRSVISACDVVAVSSEHERELLREAGIRSDDVTVVPLPVSRCDTDATPRTAAPITLGVFGFVYPGKGHAEVIAAAADLPNHVEVHGLGAVSAGHDDLLTALHRAASRQHRIFRVTGHIAEDDLIPALQAVTVPVTAHRHVSASGSLNTWLSAGRRPLAPRTRYTTEIEMRNPGSLQLFSDTPSGLCAAVRCALRNPSSTWLPDSVPLSPSPSEAADAYAGMFDMALR